MKIAIAGKVQAGKTTLAKSFLNVKHTDDLMETHGWSDASVQAARWFSDPAIEAIEGVRVPHALRKWLNQNPGKPVDKLIWCGAPKVPLSDGQQRLSTGAETVFREIEPELRRRGVEIEQR